MEQDNRNRNESVFSRKIRAGRRRTYFFDVRTTRANDYYLTITESKKRHDGDGYERHKIFLYKEDFNKFLAETTEVINFIKSKMPHFDFDAYNHAYDETHAHEASSGSETLVTKEPENDDTDNTEIKGSTNIHDDADDLKM